MKKRILSLLLAFLTVLGSVPTTAFATDSTEETQIIADTAETVPCVDCGQEICICEEDALFTESYTESVCPTCGTEDCISDHTNWCADCRKDSCGIDHRFCDVCQKNDCGVDHSTGQVQSSETSTGPRQEASAVADEPHPMVGKIVTLVERPGLLTAIQDPGISVSGNVVARTAYPEQMEIEAVQTVGNTTYYQLKAAAGFTWPAYFDAIYEHYWLPSTQVELVETPDPQCPVCGETGCTTQHVQCDKCGDYDCDKFHRWCEYCQDYDCGRTHLVCLACGTVDCQTNHIYCGYCMDYDCGISHEETAKPDTSACIPENPTLTAGAGVSIVDAYGDPVTASGFYLPEGTKASLSAWGDLTGASYQWQIRYDSANDRWADIRGENGKGILVSGAMFKGLASSQNVALRCVMTGGTGRKVSQTIPVILADQTRMTYAGRSSAAAVFSGAGQQTREQEDTGSQFRLTIRYVLSEKCHGAGRQVAIDYVGSYGSEEAVTVNVPHPAVQGYQPVSDPAQFVTQTRYERTFPAGQTGEVEVIVTYDPAEVTYLVTHYVQNVDDNNYTEVLRQTKTGITEQPVAENMQSPDNDKVSFNGLYPLQYERPAIAADGSTVIEIYYDRIYYLIGFDLGGGYGVDPVYERYGADMPNVGDPIRAGYTFGGWSLDGTTAVALPDTIPAENRKYQALWTDPEGVNVTVVYWRENPDDYGFSVWGQKEITATAGTILDGKDYALTQMVTDRDELKYFTLNKTKTDSSVEVLGDGSSIVNVYYNRNVYSVYFYAVGTCGIPEHAHSEACRILICPEEHDHDAVDCYRNDCGMTVHTHSSGANCGTFNNPAIASNTHNRNKVERPLVHAITAKYNADISDIWPMSDMLSKMDNLHKNAAGQAAHTDGTPYRAWQIGTTSSDPTVSKRLTMNYGVCDTTDGIKDAYALYATGVTLHLHYMVESFDQTSPANKESKTDTVRRNYNKKYYDVMPVHTQTVVATSNSFNHKTIDGLSYSSSAKKDEPVVSGSEYNYFLYYTRKSYDLEFYNINSSHKLVENIPFGKPLANYAGEIPEYPAGWEEGVWVFDGWYTTANCLDGTQYLFDEDDTMPAGNMTLYAKWIPDTHTVTFHRTYEDLENGIRLPEETHPTKTVYHNTYLGRINDATREGYYFVNWFYTNPETGEERAFDPENMPVTSDLQLYARWTSSVTVEYRISFRTVKDGVVVEVADTITNKSLAGQTVTYNAKVGGALYPDYQTYYFPEATSQSLTLSKEADAVNEIVFWYEKVDAMPYTVRYLDEENKSLHEDKVVSDNYQAAVTENYVPIAGYLPDASRKTLVLTTSDANAENVLIFRYTKTERNAPVRITHYTQDLNKVTGPDGTLTDGWTEYRSEETVGIIGQTYDAAALEIVGFTYDPNLGQASGNLEDYRGLYLDLYYTRNRYPYLIRYVEDGSYNTVADPETGTAAYQSLLTAEAKQIKGYTCISEQSQTISIKIEDGTEAVLNVITFKYERNMGALIISKAVEAIPVNSAPADDLFEFTVVLKDSGESSNAAASLPQPMYRFDVYDVGEDAVSADPKDSGVVYPMASSEGSNIKNSFKVSLKAGQYVLIKGLPTGIYVITEADYTHKDYLLITQPGDVALTEGQTAVAAFVNQYEDRTFDLTVTNTVELEYDGDSVPNDLFAFTLVLNPDPSAGNIVRNYTYQRIGADGDASDPVTCSAEPDGEPVFHSFFLAADERIEFYDLPIGSYTVTEVDEYKTHYTTWVNGEETYSVSGAVTSQNNAPVRADFLNIYRRHLLDLTIETDCADSTQSFLFTVSGIPADTKTYGEQIRLEVILVGTDSLTVRDLPWGEYTVTEKDGWSWRETAVESRTVELKSRTETVAFDFGMPDHVFWLNGYSYGLHKKREEEGV